MKKLEEVIEQSNGKILTVTFIKKDGTERVLNGRLGVKSHLKGGVSTVDHNQYINIFDMQAGGYRNINRDTIKSVRVGGVEYQKY
jgi:hypothetical protein